MKIVTHPMMKPGALLKMRANSITIAITPGNIHERVPTANSQGISPVPKTARCACSVTWKISSGKLMLG